RIPLGRGGRGRLLLGRALRLGRTLAAATGGDQEDNRSEPAPHLHHLTTGATAPDGGTNMHELIEAIRGAVAEDATAEAKQAGARACRTILAALETEPGQPLAPTPAAVTSAPNPLAALTGLDLERALDLVIARLRAALPDAERAAP